MSATITKLDSVSTEINVKTNISTKHVHIKTVISNNVQKDILKISESTRVTVGVGSTGNVPTSMTLKRTSLIKMKLMMLLLM